MNVRTRLARPADAEALARLAAVTFPLACPPSTTAESIADFIAGHLTEPHFTGYLADPDRTLYVAEPDDSPAGAALAASEAVVATGGLIGWSMLVSTPGGVPADADAAASVTARPAIELSKMYVHPAVHGAGVAGALMETTLDAAARAAASVVWLGVNQENRRAIRFYEKQGFEVVGTKRFRVGDRLEHDYVLERPLAEDAPPATGPISVLP
ncbi:putative N-acetyltransferase [Agromyces sp. NDB4Y10]|uniref:GNAT family N-acetyltransferase n=1 Tax=Agromyces sp. NDB4Y10 TaxID=1775951 RepID=UPI0007B26C37|nr:N-acetyltransferase [Agromyces sp. NDB4Y10]KZE88781.1 putative N-acetyltransferase [Agromyces sp. NDB4Y10]